MERRRTEITCHVSQEDLEKAADQYRRFMDYEKGRIILLGDELARYNRFKKAVIPMEEENKRLRNAVRRSEILTTEDYMITVF